MESQVERTVVVDTEGQPVMMMQEISVAAVEDEEQAASGPADRRTLHQLNVLVLSEQFIQALRPSTVPVVSEPSHDDDDDDNCDCTCGCLCVLGYIIMILVILLLLPFLPLICLCACCYICCCKDD